jgi:hypothetical protein
LASAGSLDSDGELVPQADPQDGAPPIDGDSPDGMPIAVTWKRIVDLAQRIQVHASNRGEIDRDEVSTLAKLVLLFQARMVRAAWTDVGDDE